MPSDEISFRCPLCRQVHAPRTLRRGQRAHCARCGTTMAERSWIGRNAAMAFAASGLFFAFPALLLPFVSLQEFGQIRTTHVTVGFAGLWSHGFTSLGAWVLFCGVFAPVALLGLLVLILGTDELEFWRPLNRRLRALATLVEYWAMPEVQVLGVLVAFLKLGAIVTVTVGPGLWCYAATAFCMLAAWRRFNLHPVENVPVKAEVVT
jgi:paraquat-inducible protein A